ncbi:MAG: D-alanine--D-alanine ligase [Alphaproteobacteria bacterium]|nr:D-alanine--D-alanine ligase [Alphaproteobacteria bacterium]
MQTKKVLVLKGGFSAERDVSLVSGSGVAKALKNCGFKVIEHDLTSVEDFFECLKKEKPDVVFNALHGNWGEDGAIQGFLDLLQIPYTHSNMESSLLGMNKHITKQICQENNIKVAKSEVMSFEQFKQSKSKILYPYVVKPTNDGSSVGVFIVKNDEDKNKVFYADNNREILVEEFISGKEITVAVIDDKPIAVTELKPVNEFYDYQAKYTDGATMHILPADIEEKAYKTALEYALKIHKALKCNTVSRSDFRYNPKDGVVFLEINTNPGMTPLSLVPEQAKYVGISYEDLCKKLVENAKCRKIK